MEEGNIFTFEDKFYKVEGGTNTEGKGAAFVYESENGIDWQYIHSFEVLADFGKKWENTKLFFKNEKWILRATLIGLEKNKGEFSTPTPTLDFIVQGDFRTNGFLADFVERKPKDI